jgi:hypothetical protein
MKTITEDLDAVDSCTRCNTPSLQHLLGVRSAETSTTSIGKCVHKLFDPLKLRAPHLNHRSSELKRRDGVVNGTSNNGSNPCWV